MSDLRVPFAIDKNEQLCSPETADADNCYFCPSCRNSVIFRNGKIRKPHFAHKATKICNQETIIHKSAKLLVQKVIQEWKKGKAESPLLKRRCDTCLSYVYQPLPEKVEHACVEYKFSNNIIADVALIAGGIPQAAVEIRVTHAVDETKIRKMTIPFVELDGYQIIEEPFVWKPLLDNFNPLTCNKCKEGYLKFRIQAEQVAKATNLQLPTIYYRYGLHNCWKCRRRILVFGWTALGIHHHSIPENNPPRTIQYRYSKTARCKYWANTCPYCQSVQGNFFLYSEPDGPFFGMHFIDDAPEAFDRDIIKISAHYTYTGIL